MPYMLVELMKLKKDYSCGALVVPFDALTCVWTQRQLLVPTPSVGRFSIVGTTVKCPKIPVNLLADEAQFNGTEIRDRKKLQGLICIDHRLASKSYLALLCQIVPKYSSNNLCRV